MGIAAGPTEESASTVGRCPVGGAHPNTAISSRRSQPGSRRELLDLRNSIPYLPIVAALTGSGWLAFTFALKMKTTAALISAFLLFSSFARSEEFFATAQEALVLSEIALRQNGVNPEDLVLYRMEIKPALPNQPEREGVWNQIAEQMGDRDAWILMYHDKANFSPMLNYGFSYAVVLLSKTEAAVLKTGLQEP